MAVCAIGWTTQKWTKMTWINTVLSLASDFPFADELNSMARLASAERAGSSISRFYHNCKKNVPGKKGYPQFQKDCRSVEYKTSGWKLADDRKSINFIDKKGIGRLKLKGTRDLHFYQISQIKRVRLVKRADGRSLWYYDRIRCGFKGILHRLERNYGWKS